MIDLFSWIDEKSRPQLFALCMRASACPTAQVQLVDSPKRDVDLCKIAVASKKSAVDLKNVVDFVHNLQ
jgi:hypothetical protein